MARNAIAAISIALLSLGASVAQAQTHATIVVQAGTPPYRHTAPVQWQYHPAPPPPRHEAAPRPRRGMVWVPGHWVKARPGYHYRPHRWEERDGRWRMQPGGWDRDGDGVPDRHDRQPGNPYRN